MFGFSVQTADGPKTGTVGGRPVGGTREQIVALMPQHAVVELEETADVLPVEEWAAAAHLVWDGEAWIRSAPVGGPAAV